MKTHFCSALIATLLAAGTGSPQTASPAQRKALAPEEIIQAFAAKEAEFYEAWMQYMYRQVATIKVTEVDGSPRNERLILIWEVVFRDDGTRELQLKERAGRLMSVKWTADDEDVITNIQPFALTTKELPLYNIRYERKERVDEIDTYVFSVSPKSTKGSRYYFQGQIWVDDQDLQIVRTMGRIVPQKRENQFPAFETLRQVIDGKYWFPVWTHADSVLRFPGQNVRVEETITYEDYKRFGSKVTIRTVPP